jgi:predicted Zn-dependent peptidase
MPLKHTVEELVLKNGMRGLLIDVPDSTVVSYEVHFRAGNYFAPSTKVQQTAHIMEHMTFGATEEYPTQELFSQEFTKNGAYHNATTWQYGMSYEAECAQMEWDRILDLQELAISKPVFTEEILKTEKGNVREELVGQANNRRRVIWQQTVRAMGDDMFTDPEKVKTIPAVTLGDIKEHHKKTHTIENMRFSFAGDLKKHRSKLVSQLESWDIPRGNQLEVPQTKLHSAPAVSVYQADMPSINFIFIIAVNRIFDEQEKDSLNALCHILTGSFHSRIFGKARKLGLCYSMGSSFGTEVDGVSRFEVGGQVSRENAPALFTLIKDELQKVFEGDVTEKELDDAKQYALGSHQMKAQTVDGLNSWYASDYFDTDKIDFVDKAPEQIKAVSIDNMTTLFKELVNSGIWSLGVIGAMRKPEVKRLHAILGELMKQSVK